MRQTFDPQPRLGTMPIENLTFNPRSRDDTEVLCYALQALGCDAGTRDTVRALIPESHGERINAANGRPAWTSDRSCQVRVFAGMKPGPDLDGIDCDRRANRVSNHRDLRSLAGLSHVCMKQ